jgi:hypothetical protein
VDAKSKELPPANPDELVEFVIHFTDRLYLVFAYPFFVCEFRRDLPLRNTALSPLDLAGLRPVRLITICRACVYTSLMALRDMDNVLAVKRDKEPPDDVKAHSFGYPGGSFLTSDERKTINKVVVHSTTHAYLIP